MERYYRDREIRRRFGNISEMTLWRWRKGRKFPQPDLVIGGHNYTAEPRVLSWEQDQMPTAFKA